MSHLNLHRDIGYSRCFIRSMDLYFLTEPPSENSYRYTKPQAPKIQQFRSAMTDVRAAHCTTQFANVHKSASTFCTQDLRPYKQPLMIRLWVIHRVQSAVLILVLRSWPLRSC